MVFFFSIEIVSFSLYYLILSKNNKLVIVEAALKYFVFSLIASAFILQSLILFYGFFGINNFFEVYLVNSFFIDYYYFYFFFGTSVYVSYFGFFFKLALAPFHFWSPDVLETVNFGVFLFFVLFTKIVYFFIMLRFFFRF